MEYLAWTYVETAHFVIIQRSIGIIIVRPLRGMASLRLKPSATSSLGLLTT